MTSATPEIRPLTCDPNDSLVGTVVAFLLPGLVYLATLAPTIYSLDSAELTTAAATGGLVRATGYPTYLMLGRLWSLIPIGDVGFRMNLFSAFCGALTLALTERILRRLGVGPWARFGALGLLASARFFWAMSLVAEVYTLHTVFQSALILALLRWREEPGPHLAGTVGLLLGVSLGNHLATSLMIPGVAWLGVMGLRPQLRSATAVRCLVVAGVALALGASTYLYLPWVQGASPGFNYAGAYTADGTFVPLDLGDPASLLWLVTGRGFAEQMLGYDTAGWFHELGAFGVHLWQAFVGLGIGPAILGWVLLARRRPTLTLGFALLFVAHSIFYIDYRTLDKDTMFLPIYVLWALALGVGYQGLLDWVGQESERGRGLLRVVLVAAVLAAMVWTWPQVDRSRDNSTRLRAELILRHVEPDALILGWWATVPPLEYLQQVEGRRPDVRAINRFLIAPEHLAALVEQEIDHRPIYLDGPASHLEAFELESQWPLYRVRRILSERDPPER